MPIAPCRCRFAGSLETRRDIDWGRYDEKLFDPGERSGFLWWQVSAPSMAPIFDSFWSYGLSLNWNLFSVQIRTSHSQDFLVGRGFPLGFATPVTHPRNKMHKTQKRKKLFL